MLLDKKISTALSYECKLTDKALIQEYIMNRKDAILSKHITNVDQIHEPGYGGFKYYTTKLTPKNRNHSGLIYAKTKEELETKIIAHYLHIQEEGRITVRKVLVDALGGNEDSFGKTSKRAIQRFDKNLSDLGSIILSRLTETDIRAALDKLVATKPTEKEFNETVSCLNKIADHCQYEHIDIINIRDVISVYRKVRLTGKHLWKSVSKQTKNLAFTRTEASRIVRFAIKYPTYKSLSVAILITTGLRAGELLGLEIDDIYLEEGYLWIHQTEDTKTYELLDYVKENKTREVYLSDEALTIIKACLSFRINDNNNSPYLILNPCSNDGKMHLRAIDDFMREVIHTKVLGYDKEREARSAHDCRRTYASLEHLSGTPINVIMDQLGHRNVGQTWDYIKNIVEASERRRQLKGGRLIFDEVKPQKLKKTHKQGINAG
ncbi:MAG: site-specific integrase [Lachnospiraceae bacterium]|nr:site-specific integrase [Lachnospiraceae bacterium]